MSVQKVFESALFPFKSRRSPLNGHPATNMNLTIIVGLLKHAAR